MGTALVLAAGLLSCATPQGHPAVVEEVHGSLGQAVAPIALLGSLDIAGVFEANRTGTIAPTWQNVGMQPLSLVTGSVSNFTGPAGATYTIFDTAASYGALPVGASAACYNSPNNDCYSVSASAPTRPMIHWDATITETISQTGDVKTWTLHIGSSFSDVPPYPANIFNSYVETLLHHDVTAGCTPTTYCPLAPAAREQMAVFVLVAKEPPGYSPPACGAPMFADVPASSPFCRWIEELARRGVVAGCGGGNYCPKLAVSRAQMPVFVLRTLDPAINPPACGTPLFADLPASSPFCRWVEELVRRGVLVGCGTGNYCPDTAVTRETMSAFIARGFGLALYAP